MLVGYKLVDQQGGVVEQWGGRYGQCPSIPTVLYLPNGDHVLAPEPGRTYQGYTLSLWEWNLSDFTITSAAYTNPDHTAAVLQTNEAGAVLVSLADTPELWAQMLGSVTVDDYSGPPLEVPSTVKDYQFAGQAVKEGKISLAEKRAWIKGDPPESLLDAIQQMVNLGAIDEDQQDRLIDFLSGATDYPRHHPNTEGLAAILFQLPPGSPELTAELDRFFVEASAR